METIMKEWKQLSSWDRLEIGDEIRIRWVTDVTKHRRGHDEWRDAVCIEARKGMCRARMRSGTVIDLDSVRQFQVYR